MAPVGEPAEGAAHRPKTRVGATRAGRAGAALRATRAHERPGSPGCPPAAHPCPRRPRPAEHGKQGVQVGGTLLRVGICPRRCPGNRPAWELPRAARAGRDGRGPRAKWGQNVRNPPRFPWRDFGQSAARRFT